MQPDWVTWCDIFYDFGLIGIVDFVNSVLDFLGANFSWTCSNEG